MADVAVGGTRPKQVGNGGNSGDEGAFGVGEGRRITDAPWVLVVGLVFIWALVKGN